MPETYMRVESELFRDTDGELKFAYTTKNGRFIVRKLTPTEKHLVHLIYDIHQDPSLFECLFGVKEGGK